MTTLQELRDIIAKIRRVVSGDTILPEDHNLQTDALSKIADILEGLTIAGGRYKLIATAYKKTSADGNDIYYLLYSPWNNEYVIGETVFPDLNQVLQPYDLLIFNNYYHRHIYLAGAHTEIWFNAYRGGDLSIKYGEQVYAYQNFYENHRIAYPTDVESWDVDDGIPMSITFIIPPDLPSFNYYNRFYSGINNITPYIHQARIEEYAFLYRLQ